MKKALTVALTVVLLACAGKYAAADEDGAPDTEFETYGDIRAGVLGRLLRYVTIETTSDPNAVPAPSTPTQTAFAELLAAECKAIGLVDIEVSEYGIVTATLPGNIEGDVPVIAFIAHMDTSPEASGKDVVPRVHENYDGGDIVLDRGITISPDEFPAMKNYIGQTIITASGGTLLGADDKSGIAIILTAMEHLIRNPDIPHGKIRIAFTPDEEIGRGTENFNTQTFGADFAFTVDGGPLGELYYENFNAARAFIEVKGKSIHPGHAKGIMINAGLIAAEAAAMLPEDERPANTEGYEGFYHVTHIEGGIENANLEILIRCFDTDEYAARKGFIVDLVNQLKAKYGDDTLTLSLTDTYANMREKIDPWIIEYAKAAYRAAGVEPVSVATRGGTDGAWLSDMGLPCPNLFTGMYNYHGPYEFITLETMEKAVDVIVNLCANIETAGKSAVTLGYDVYNITGAPLIDEPDAPNYIGSFNSPHIEGLNDSELTAYVNQYLQNEAQKSADIFKRDYDDLRRQADRKRNVKEKAAMLQRADRFEYLAQMMLVTVSDKYFAVAETRFEDKAGAHPSQYIRLFNFDTDERRFIKLGDLFKNDDWQAIITEKLNEQAQTDAYKDVLFADQSVSIINDTDFYITPGSLVIFYQPADAAPRAAGFIVFEIPLNDITDILKDKYAGAAYTEKTSRAELF